MILNHNDMILLARLIGCHSTGTDDELSKVATKLLDYAERNGVSIYDIAPLPLEDGDVNGFYKGRIMFRLRETHPA